jgi:voltage-gated sodium channel
MLGWVLFAEHDPENYGNIVLNSMEEARSADRKEHETDDLLARLRQRAALGDAEQELQKTHRDDR